MSGWIYFQTLCTDDALSDVSDTSHDRRCGRSKGPFRPGAYGVQRSFDATQLGESPFASAEFSNVFASGGQLASSRVIGGDAATKLRMTVTETTEA